MTPPKKPAAPEAAPLAGERKQRGRVDRSAMFPVAAPGGDMPADYASWPDREVVQVGLAQVTWDHDLTLLEKLDKAEDRRWFAARTVEHGWSRNILGLQIEGRAHLRHGSKDQWVSLDWGHPLGVGQGHEVADGRTP